MNDPVLVGVSAWIVAIALVLGVAVCCWIVWAIRNGDKP